MLPTARPSSSLESLSRPVLSPAGAPISLRKSAPDVSHAAWPTSASVAGRLVTSPPSVASVVTSSARRLAVSALVGVRASTPSVSRRSMYVSMQVSVGAACTVGGDPNMQSSAPSSLVPVTRSPPVPSGSCAVQVRGASGRTWK